MSSKDETNAAMPQRIDMTQFDNITSYSDGGWEVPEEDNLSKTLVADLDGSLVCSTSEMAQIEGYPLEEAQRFARIIAQLPNIVAELKRMYEREDFLMNAREIWLIEEQRLEKQVEVYREKMLQSVGRTSDIEKDLRKALRIIRDDLDDALEVYPTINQEDIVKVRNFANDASQ